MDLGLCTHQLNYWPRNELTQLKIAIQYCIIFSQFPYAISTLQQGVRFFDWLAL